VNREDIHARYAQFVNPDFVELLEMLDYGRCFVRAQGTRLYDDAGREYLDFLAGFGVHNVGHNHPHLVDALHKALESAAPSMLNIDAPACQAQLAEALSSATHPNLCRASFANSGAEAVDIALKTARAATGRKVIVACEGGYHGLSLGAMSVLGQSRMRSFCGPLLQDVRWASFGDVDALREICRREKPAAFIVEPIQGEGGVRVPSGTYLREASEACRASGTLLIADEIQTGLGRTGRLFDTPFEEVCPDILLLGKALSGGIVPIAVALTTPSVWRRAFRGPERCNLNASTFAGGHLACTAALAVLDILRDEALPEAAAARGEQLLAGLKRLAEKHSIVRDVRGRGLLVGVEFGPATGLSMRVVPAWARDGLFAQVVCALLMRDHGIVAQPCSLAGSVLRIEPPLTIGEQGIERFLCALDSVLDACPTPRRALAMAARKRVLGRAL
jgi:putrescine aminotransferase